MRGRLGACAVLVGCSFRPNPASSFDGNPGGEAAAIIDAAGSGSGSVTHDAAVDAPIDAPATTPLPCAGSYVLTDLVHPSLYRQVTASASWTSAETDCENDEVTGVTAPAHLIVLDDAGEATYIWTLMNSDQWVGHSDRITEGNFLPVTDQQGVYTGNAAGNDGGKDCLMVHNTGGATTADTCTNGHPYVCECDGRAANPGNF